MQKPVFPVRARAAALPGRCFILECFCLCAFVRVFLCSRYSSRKHLSVVPRLLSLGVLQGFRKKAAPILASVRWVHRSDPNSLTHPQESHLLYKCGVCRFPAFVAGLKGVVNERQNSLILARSVSLIPDIDG